MSDLTARVERWIDDDPDPETRDELIALRDGAADGDESAHTELGDRFAGLLGFGTAGLRGALGAGPNRMNVAVVLRAAAGIAAWVRERHDASDSDVGATDPRIVIGYDARHRSIDFARESARVFAAAGIHAMLLPEPTPTPVLAFAVGHLGCAAGVMVTASHNPPEDNGYKVYDSSGSQIVDPSDRRIAAVLEGIEAVADIPLADEPDDRIEHLDGAIIDAYVDAAVTVPDPDGPRDVRIAYTPMHGVGAAVFRRVFDRAGFPTPVEVREQIDPDPEFPTVAFPNPEEPGALDLGRATAARADVDLLIANDPDADRLGVAVPDPALGEPDDPASWRILRGDEIGAILADHLLRGDNGPDDVVATTIVSSTLLHRLAGSAGVRSRETLTGFKWLSRAAADGERLRFAYEEALGFAVAPELVADKDGITAALVFCEAAARQREAGRTVLDVLDDLDRRHGVHRTGQWSTRVDGGDAMSRLRGAMAALRVEPPTELAGLPVERIDDLAHGFGDLPPGDVLVLHLAGARIVVRPSGTEPKLKCYLEVLEPVGDEDGALASAGRRADERLTALADAIAATTGLA